MSGGPRDVALFTDLYELTMLQAYVESSMLDTATFDMVIRRLPTERNFFIACGLGDLLSYLETLAFEPEALAYLDSLGRFSPRFLDWLGGFRFRGDVRAMPEGTVVFANEPLVEVTASLPEAQLIETFVLNQVGLQTMLAAKAARVVEAAAGRPVVDFGMRRAHGTDAAVKGARAFAVAGIGVTSNVLAGREHGLPVSGTMAHSFIQAHDCEREAFRAFARLYPETVLLVDCYDTLGGVREVVALADELGDDFRVTAIRLDSGDLLGLSRAARRILDEAGLERVEIFASGSLDERIVADLVARGAPIDGFGVGSRLAVAADAPVLDSAYKLVEYAGVSRVKLSAGKSILPGRKQVFRVEDDAGIAHDVVARWDERLAGRPLLVPVMRGGRRLPAGDERLPTIRARAACEVDRLPPRLRSLETAEPPYEVRISTALAAEHERCRRHLEEARGVAARAGTTGSWPSGP